MVCLLSFNSVHSSFLRKMEKYLAIQTAQLPDSYFPHLHVGIRAEHEPCALQSQGEGQIVCS